MRCTKKNPALRNKDEANTLKQPVNAGSDYISNESLSNETGAQCLRLLEALRNAPVTTLQARQQLAICSPAPRIMELRKSGYKIITTWKVDTDSMGKEHRVGQYVLISEKGASNDCR